MTGVAVVTDQSETLVVARAALEEVLVTGADLTVVGVVTPRFQAPQPATGERIRQRRFVAAVVDSALALARDRGIAAEGAITSGRPVDAGLREAHARAASAVFVPRAPSRLRRRTNPSTERIALASERQLGVAKLAA